MNHESGIKNKSTGFTTFSSHERGFTLIELLVVVSVIGILSVLAIASYNNYNQVQVLQTSANEVAVALNFAKSRALSQVKLGTCALTTRTLSGYGVAISAPRTYTLNVFCSGVIGPQIISSKNLPSDITFTSSPSFFFPVLTGGAQATGSPPLWQFNLTGYGQTKCVTVSSVGIISQSSSCLPPPPPPPAPCTDNDGDGYGNPASSSCTFALLDCLDSNASVNPGVTGYFPVNRGDGSFDYNCDGVEEKDPTRDCLSTFVGTGCTVAKPAGSQGYIGTVPACGGGGWGSGFTHLSIWNCPDASCCVGNTSVGRCGPALDGFGSYTRRVYSNQIMHCR